MTTACDNRMITKYIIFANMITDKVDLSTNQRCVCGLSQIIRLNVITFSALLNDGMTTYRSSHGT